MALTIGDILKTEDLERKAVDVEQWGGAVFVRSITSEERSGIEKLYSGKKRAADDPNGFRRVLLAKCLVNEDGSPLADETQMEELMRKSSAAIETLFDAALELNAFREKDVKELEKNSNGNQPES